MAASIFISHSAKDAPARQYLDAIASALRQAGFDVWLDETRLKGSDDWGVVIANAMASCHGAVVLFSTESIKSGYVEFEVSNLFARWQREKANPLETRFRFCPIVVPPLTVDDVKSDLFVRAIKLDTNNWIATPDPASAITRLLDTFTGLAEWPSPFEQLAGAVSSTLGKVSSAAVLLGAAGDAGFNQHEMNNPASYPTQLARLLTLCPIDRLCAALRSLSNALTANDIGQLFDLLGPSWVSFEAGQQFKHCLSSGPSTSATPIAIINGIRTEFTPRMYLLRARGLIRATAGHIIQVTAPSLAGMSEPELFDNVRTELLAWIRMKFANRRPDVGRIEAAVAKGSATADTLLQSLVNDLVSANAVFVISLAVEPVDLDLVARVSARPALQRVAFVALIGSETPAPPPSRAQLIEPRLSLDYEKLAFDHSDTLLSELNV